MYWMKTALRAMVSILYLTSMLCLAEISFAHIIIRICDDSFVPLVSTDIDECLSRDDNNCDINANCMNSNGSFSCACKLGFSGDGLIDNCTSKILYRFSD